MINPEYIDPVKAVAAYNDQIKNNGYTQIPINETSQFFREVRPVEGNIEASAHADRINTNTQYYRNGLSDYHLTKHNCVTTTIIPILQGISFDKLSPEAKVTVKRLMKNPFDPATILTILSDDIVYFLGKGLISRMI